MLGQPKYKIGDRVTFRVYINATRIERDGTIIDVDPYGTYVIRGEVSYDILCDDNIKYQHISERHVEKIK